jgi:hypothetical protein
MWDEESRKVAIDCIKHITTLASGSILVIGTFSEKFITSPQGRITLIVAASFMLLCVATGLYLLISEGILPHRQGEHKFDVFLTKAYIILMGTAFILGMVTVLATAFIQVQFSK